MTIVTKYIRPNITVDAELVGLNKFYVYNYKGVHYRIFDSLMNLRDFMASGYKT